MKTRSPFLTIIAAALLAVGALSANAQTSTTTLPGTTTTTGSIAPAPAPIGLSVTGWQLSSSIGQGYNVGGDQTKQGVITFADGFFSLGADSYLTGNSNPNCTADCASTQAKLWITGQQMTGARAFNEGIGTQTAPIASIAGTNGMFSASLKTSWVYTAPPTTTPTAP